MPRFPRLSLVAVLAAALVMPPSSALGADTPPDQVQPPVKGEGQPLADPTDPTSQAQASPAPQMAFTARGTGLPAQAVELLAGGNRFQTAVTTSRTGWPNGATAAVLVSGETFTDALVSAPLAGTLGSPLLLTPAGSLDPDTAAELQRLAPTVVYVVGALDPLVAAGVTALGLTVERIEAANHFEVAVAVAHRAVALGADPSTVLIASAADYADPLTASALAAAQRHPILLTAPQGMETWLAARVAELGASRSWVVGGSAALPDSAVAGLPGLERIAGGNRAETATRVADRMRALGNTGNPILVVADGFADGLVGGVFAGVARRAPLLVTTRRELSLPTVLWLDGTHTPGVTLVGGGLSSVAICQLFAGDTRSFLCVEEEMAKQGYNVGPVDGAVGAHTIWALYAFQKVAGRRVDNHFDEGDWQALMTRPDPGIRRPDLPADHSEIDLARQLIIVVRGGAVARVFHTSTGKSSTPTVRGAFSVYEKRNYRQANHMYRPVFWHRGYAFHGYPSVPLYPASHGCSRMWDGDMDVFFPMLTIGERVATY